MKSSFPDILLSALLLVVLLLHAFHAAFDDTPLLIVVACIGFLPVARGAVRSWRDGEWASMDLLASVALIFSLIGRAWVSALFIELMLAAARILDDVTRDRTEQSIRGLLTLRPAIATVEHEGVLARVPLARVAVGDIVVVDIGERIPIDGTVIGGGAAVDESSLTGESLPVDKQSGDEVLSSTLVSSGNLRIQVKKIGSETTLERVIALVQSARKEKPAVQTQGELFGKIYLTIIFFGSMILWLCTRDIKLVLAVVLVVCADDIAVAIPLAYLRAIQAAATNGIIVKGARHLETLGRISTMVFDKTGTLTKGTLAIATVITAEQYGERDVLQVATLAARRSSHPLSRALIAHAQTYKIPEEYPDTVEERGGKGIIATRGITTIVLGKQSLFEELKLEIPPFLLRTAFEEADLGRSLSYVAENGVVIGCVCAADAVKENASQSLVRLHALGITRTVMLSGDNARAAGFMAKQVGIDEWHADLLPEQKVENIRNLQAQEPVAMVGDGVNDAAALSIASVGIAMGGLGTEGAIEAAQIVLMRDDLSKLPMAVEIARSTRRIASENFWIWGLTNMLGLALVFGGFIGPSGAAAFNFVTDFIPLWNSLRLKRYAG